MPFKKMILHCPNDPKCHYEKVVASVACSDTTTKCCWASFGHFSRILSASAFMPKRLMHIFKYLFQTTAEMLTV